MANAWFPRLTDGKPTWAAREATSSDSVTITPNSAAVTAEGRASGWQGERILTPGVGRADVLGRLTDSGDRLRPSVGAIIVSADLFPTIITVRGPYAAPERAAVTMAGKQPFMRSTRIVYPLLPDSPDVEDAGLAPTILRGNSSSAGVPGVGLVETFGNQPLLIIDNTFRAEVAAQYPPLVAAGLAPTIGLDPINEPLKTPRVGLAEMYGRAPALLTDLQQEVPLGGITADGLQPSLVGLRYDWLTVALTGSAVWTDVPGVE